MSSVCLRGGCAALTASAHGDEVGKSGFSWHDSSLLCCAYIVMKRKILKLDDWFTVMVLKNVAVGGAMCRKSK